MVALTWHFLYLFWRKSFNSSIYINKYTIFWLILFVTKKMQFFNTKINIEKKNRRKRVSVFLCINKNTMICSRNIQLKKISSYFIIFNNSINFFNGPIFVHRKNSISNWRKSDKIKLLLHKTLLSIIIHNQHFISRILKF